MTNPSKPFLSGAVRKFGVVFVPYTGRRSFDNMVAQAVAFGMEFGPLLVKMINQDLVGVEQELERIGRDAGTWVRSRGFAGGMTWYHNEIMGVMEWLNAADNKPSHVGGIKFWEIINGKPYYTTAEVSRRGLPTKGLDHG